MPRPRPHFLVLLASALAVGALAAPAPVATKTPAAKAAPAKPAPYVMTGVVRNAAGQPLADVEVYADNTVYYDMNVVGKTDARGRYRLELPHAIGTWRPGASVKRPWGDQIFRFTVHPDDPSAFSAKDGAVRDFVWRTEGPHDGGVLGRHVNVYVSDERIDDATLELTFTPEGPLVDGRTVKPFTRRLTGGRVVDVPVGRYRVSARHAPNGTPQALEVQAEGQKTFAASSPATFRETLYGIRMEVSLRVP